jgi:hypothetical protein
MNVYVFIYLHMHIHTLISGDILATSDNSLPLMPLENNTITNLGVPLIKEYLLINHITMYKSYII